MNSSKHVDSQSQSIEMQSKLKLNLKSDYVKTIIFLILMMVSVFGFWYG